MSFNIGDRVIYNLNGSKEGWDKNPELNDVVGVIVSECPFNTPAYGVDFTCSLGEDYFSEELHSLEGVLTTSTGYWVSAARLAHTKPTKLYELEEML
jgi:hypothetical protein